MAFTPIAIEGLYTNADGTPASGTLCARPSSAMVNYASTPQELSTDPICGLLDDEGRIVSQSYEAFQIYATDDASTFPQGAYYVFSLQLDGDGLVEFSSPVPNNSADAALLYGFGCADSLAHTTADSPTVVLGTLVAGTALIGSPVTGANIPGETTILSVDPAANTVTLSNNATATGTDTAFTIEEGCVQLFALRQNAL